MSLRINQGQPRIDRIRNRITHAQMRAEMEARGLSALAAIEGEHEEILRFATSRSPMGGDRDVVAGADAVPMVPRQNDGEGRP